MFKITKQRGQSLVEVIIAMAVFALMASAIATMVVGGFNSLIQGGQQTEALALAQEGIEAVRSIHDGAWNEIEDGCGVATVSVSGSEWVLNCGVASEAIGKYTRTITFSDVCRDGSDDIAACPGSYTDVHSIKATVTVDWAVGAGNTNSVVKTAYFTNWDSTDWTEDLTADFNDGILNNTATSSTMGDADGAIILESL